MALVAPTVVGGHRTFCSQGLIRSLRGCNSFVTESQPEPVAGGRLVLGTTGLRPLAHRGPANRRAGATGLAPEDDRASTA